MAGVDKRGAPKRAKGASKKKKSQWRKTDIQDVEDFLEDKRLEERLGGDFDLRPDQQLFVVDEKGAGPSDATSVGADLPEGKGAKRAARKAAARTAKLNCHKNLEITGGVADPKKVAGCLEEIPPFIAKLGSKN